MFRLFLMVIQLRTQLHFFPSVYPIDSFRMKKDCFCDVDILNF